MSSRHSRPRCHVLAEAQQPPAMAATPSRPPAPAASHLFIPAAAERWIGDPTQPLYVSFSRMEAEAGCVTGRCFIALPETWSCRSAPAPKWDRIALAGRRVLLVVPAGVPVSPPFLGALFSLLDFLTRHGATLELTGFS